MEGYGEDEAHNWLTYNLGISDLVDAKGTTLPGHRRTHSPVIEELSITAMTAAANQPAKRRCIRLPMKAVRTLEDWLLQHHSKPYPTPRHLDDLEAQTGLNRRQIINWFANARKRGKSKHLQHQVPQDDVKDASSLPLAPHLAGFHPFEQWLYLGPEHEAASPADILRALESTPPSFSPNHGFAQYVRLFKNEDGEAESIIRQPASDLSMEVRPYPTTALSICSDQWKNPFGQESSVTASSHRHRRQRRRREGSRSYVASVANGGSGSVSDRKFQCTFCPDSFKKKHDWVRHEKSQHLRLDRWICCPQGSVNVDPKNNDINCAFCNELDPDPQHIQKHSYPQCVSRPLEERTFYRKDHLRQHLRLVHNGCPMTPAMDAWKQSAVAAVRSRCGFCDVQLDTWDSRVEHLADHFRRGAAMVNWTGDWGFDKEISDMLDQAILPAARFNLSRSEDVRSCLVSEPETFLTMGADTAETLISVDETCFGSFIEESMMGDIEEPWNIPSTACQLKQPMSAGNFHFEYHDSEFSGQDAFSGEFGNLGEILDPDLHNLLYLDRL